MSKNQQFQKFITQKSNAARKEQFKQEKRAAKKERAAAIDKRYEEKRRQQQARFEEQKNAPGKKTGSIKRIQTNSQPPITKGQQPAANNQQPTAKAQQPTPNTQGPTPSAPLPGQMPLNKFIAHSGVCSRRDAADLVKNGEVKVNQQVITEPGFKVTEADIITVKGKRIRPTQNLVYILLNKPKDYITTLDDPQGRKTILELIRRATPERVYPVGRLDRNTSGVLLITNDGELAQTLSHPKNLVKKIYEVRLDKPLTKAHFEQMAMGLELEDGFIAPDVMGYADPKDKSVIGIEIHSGRNRIVRRMFEHLGYDVVNLDRVMYAGLTKKNVTRGKWRFLTEKEIRILRHFNPQTKKDREKKGKTAKNNGHGKRTERRD
ncbi:MAG: rRNA pseudouridine synthase [Bacteroidota bacterium]|nr:rRNA pseudouridine synthase [Bacteroidota bacterium]